MVCVVAEDANTYTVYALDGHIYTSPATPTRSYLLFGYVGDDLWVWLGTQESPKVQIDDPGLAADERATSQPCSTLVPGMRAGLKPTWGWSCSPLPENWQAQTDEAEFRPS